MSSHRILVRFLLLLPVGMAVLLSRASAEPLALFEDGIPGRVTGSEGLLPPFSCDSIPGLPPGEPFTGSAGLRATSPSLPAPEGERILALTTGAEGSPLAVTRWRYDFSLDGAAILSLRWAFATGDDPARGDAWAILLDGHPLACGNAADTGTRPVPDLEAFDLVSGWHPARSGEIGPGFHSLEAFVADGGSPEGPSALFLDAVEVEPLSVQRAPTPCRPAPPEDVGELGGPRGTFERWSFDDNRFCPAGPGLPCSRIEPDGTFFDPNPGFGFVNSTNLSFEMYVVADCGTEMHVPLFDVESGCIAVFDAGRNPVPITVSNGFGFNGTGGEVCWNAQDCSGGMGNQPGGPGDNATMDVEFTGSPNLCGVYILRFRSWAGCIWDLVANCDGTLSEQFEIYDDLCLAQGSVNPLPEMVLENLQAADAGGCSETYCVGARNLGCVPLPSGATVSVGNGFETDTHAVAGLVPGGVQTLCGDLAVPYLGPPQGTTVVAVSDPVDAVLECSESGAASSCNAVSGSNSLSASVLVADTEPPVIVCPPDEVRFADDTCCTDWAETASATDNCDAQPEIFASPALPARLCGVGSHRVDYVAMDAAGNTAACSTFIILLDLTPPTVSAGAIACLWPPHHKLVDSGLAISASDNCTAAGSLALAVTGVASDEETAEQLGAGGPVHCPDAVVDGLTVLLRAERSGHPEEDGRVYRIGVSATDEAGNVATATAETRVPHDQDPKTPGQVPGNDPDGPCPAADSGRVVDATACP